MNAPSPAATPPGEPSPVASLLATLSQSDREINLSLWKQVCTPDQSATKVFNRGGGFKGTATNAVYLIRCATELWGPMGTAWGIRVVDEKIIDGASVSTGDRVHVDKVYVIRAEIFYPGGVVPAYGQTILCGVNKYGPYTDEEAPKKSLTDALTKALSWLGFAADIHMGLWDDNKHVNDRSQRQPASSQQSAAQAPPAGQRQAPAQQQAATALSQARKRAMDAGLTPTGAAAAALELTNGASRSFSEIPEKALKRIAEAGLTPETVARWNKGPEAAQAQATAAAEA